MQINFKLLSEAIDINDNLEIIHIDPNHERDTPENSRAANKLIRGTAIEDLMSKFGHEAPKSLTLTSDQIAIHKSNNLIAFHKGNPVAHCWVSKNMYPIQEDNDILPVASIVRYLAGLPINLPFSIVSTREYLDSWFMDPKLYSVAKQYGIVKSSNPNDKIRAFNNMECLDIIVDAHKDYRNKGIETKLADMLMKEKAANGECFIFNFVHNNHITNDYDKANRRLAKDLNFVPYTCCGYDTEEFRTNTFLVKIIL